MNDFTPFHIYNGTPLGVPQDVKGQLLPINQLKGNPPTEDCSVSNVHRCINAGIANSVQMAIGYPLDTAKVWIQSNQQNKPFTIRNLYSGIKYPLIGQGAMTALCFSTYDYGIQQKYNPILAGFASGSLISLLVVPFEIMKITNQYEPIRNRPIHLLPLYSKCLIPVFMRETPYITVFLNLQRWFKTNTEIHPSIYGAICSSASWILTYPMDTYKTNKILFHSLGKTIPRRPLFDRGLAYSLFRVSLGGSIFMTVYNKLQV